MRLIRLLLPLLAAAAVVFAFATLGAAAPQPPPAPAATAPPSTAGATFVAARQETAAACMADGYAAVTGLPGIVTVHQGPGYANALTGMIEAAKSRTGLVQGRGGEVARPTARRRPVFASHRRSVPSA